MFKSIIAIALVTVLSGCSAIVGYQPNTSGQTGRAESDSPNAMQRSENAQQRADAAAKSGER